MSSYNASLGESFNFVVPKAVVTKESAEYFGSHPIGTGPFILQSWTKGSEAVLVRNPRYFRKGLPYLDKIIAYSNVASSVITLRIEKGEVDGYGVPTELLAADVQQVRHDSTYAHYLVIGPTTWVKWLTLNVREAPFDKLAARQAVALAINRRHLVQLLGGTARPAYQAYFPSDPQYDPTLDQHAIYPYDPQRAAALLKASGYRSQPLTVLYSTDFPQDPIMAPGIAQDLKQIGLNVTLRGVSQTTLGSISQSLSGHPITFWGWSMDYADAYDAYSQQLSCVANAVGAGSTAPSYYCDPVADALVNKAEALPLGADRDALMRQAQRRILQSATRIPTVFPETFEMVSPRIGGFYVHPVFAWRFEDYWLKP